MPLVNAVLENCFSEKSEKCFNENKINYIIFICNKLRCVNLLFQHKNKNVYFLQHWEVVVRLVGEGFYLQINIIQQERGLLINKWNTGFFHNSVRCVFFIPFAEKKIIVLITIFVELLQGECSERGFLLKPKIIQYYT